MFYINLYWSNCQSFCNFLLKYRVTPVILWKIPPGYGNFAETVIFCFSFWQEYPSPDFFTQMPFVTNSMSAEQELMTILNKLYHRPFCSTGLQRVRSMSKLQALVLVSPRRNILSAHNHHRNHGGEIKLVTIWIEWRPVLSTAEIFGS